MYLFWGRGVVNYELSDCVLFVVGQKNFLDEAQIIVSQTGLRTLS